MRILVSGILGYMGSIIADLCAKGKEGAVLAGGVDINAASGQTVHGAPVFKSFEDVNVSFDLIIDFSHRSNTADLLAFATKKNVALVLATTGQTPQEKEAIKAASASIPLFFAANFSIGITVLIRMAKIAALALPDAEIEIVEKHHDRKLDAPSGTALAIADAIKTVRPGATYNLGRSGQGKRTPEEIGIHAIRMGNIVGEHEVLIGTQNETISLGHTAYSRAVFADGAIAAAAWLFGKCPGLYDMNSLVAE